MRMLKLGVFVAVLGSCLALTAFGQTQRNAQPAPKQPQNSAPKPAQKSVSKAAEGSVSLMAILNEAGFTTIDASPRIDPAYRKAFIRVMRDRGAADASFVQVGQSTIIIAVEFSNEAALKAVMNAGQPLIRYKRALILCGTPPNEMWNELSRTLQSRGATLIKGKEINRLIAPAASVISQLQTIRGQIELYAIKHKGEYPDFAGSQWRDLVNGKFLASPPLNPMAAKDAATKLVVVSKAGATGADAASTSAGWVWNSVDHVMYPAGTTEEKLDALMKEDDGIDIDHWLLPPDLVLKDNLELARLAIEVFHTYARIIDKKDRYPSVVELEHGKTELKKVPANPFNGSTTVQQAKWKAAAPPVSGTAGWNYDPEAGKFWANSTVVGENEW
jgi:hypothetical protein